MIALASIGIFILSVLYLCVSWFVGLFNKERADSRLKTVLNEKLERTQKKGNIPKVKRHVAIGFAVAFLFGLLAFDVLVLGQRQIFIPESNLSFVRDINGRNSITLSSTRNETGTASAYNSRQPIYPIEKGLQKNTDYACRIIDKTGKVAIALDQWPVFKLKWDRRMVQHGVFNDNNYLPLSVGDYTIQLVKILDKQGVIVAENDFSIIPYNKQTLSKLVVYLQDENSKLKEKYYDSYTVKKEPFAVGILVQVPKGKKISGTVKFFKTGHNGVFEQTPWDNERSFSTDSSGEPLKVSGMAGRIPPGIYHFQIRVDDTIIADLKLII